MKEKLVDGNGAEPVSSFFAERLSKCKDKASFCTKSNESKSNLSKMPKSFNGKRNKRKLKMKLKKTQKSNNTGHGHLSKLETNISHFAAKRVENQISD